jgi:hypothetical protein
VVCINGSTQLSAEPSGGRGPKRAANPPERSNVLAAPRLLKTLFIFWGVAHLLFGIAGAALPRWFFSVVPPWPPLHIGQIQIGGVFDLAMAAAFLFAATDVDRYAPLMIPVGVVAEGGHAAVRIGHVMLGDNPLDDLLAPICMAAFAVYLAVAGVRLRASSKS